MYEIKNFIKPELLILVPVLYIVGKGIKRTKIVHATRIPFILGILGVVLATIYSMATSDLSNYKSMLMCVFVGITQGITCAGLSVYTNQLIVVQPKERKKINNNSEKSEKTKKKNNTKNNTKA